MPRPEQSEIAEFDLERIYTPRLKLVSMLVDAGAIEQSDKKSGFRLNEELVDEVVADYQKLDTLRAVGDDGQEIDLDIEPGEEEHFTLMMRQDFRWLAWELVNKEIVDTEVARMAGLLCRPSTIEGHYSLETGTTKYNWKTGLALADFLVQEFAEEADTWVIKTPLITKMPEMFGLRFNAIELIFANDAEFMYLERALSESEIKLNRREKNMLILMKNLGHEYGHALTQAKIYDNILRRIKKDVALDTPTRDERYARMAEYLGGRPGDDLIDTVNRAYKEEENRYLNWVYFKGSTPPEILGDQKGNERIKWSGQERISRAMEKVALREALSWILLNRGEDDSKAQVVAERMQALEGAQQFAEIEELLTLMNAVGLTVTEIDLAVKEISRRRPECGLHGYSLSKLFGYVFPLTDEELVRVLKPME